MRKLLSILIFLLCLIGILYYSNIQKWKLARACYDLGYTTAQTPLDKEKVWKEVLDICRIFNRKEGNVENLK